MFFSSFPIVGARACFKDATITKRRTRQQGCFCSFLLQITVFSTLAKLHLMVCCFLESCFTSSTQILCHNVERLKIYIYIYIYICKSPVFPARHLQTKWTLNICKHILFCAKSRKVGLGVSDHIYIQTYALCSGSQFRGRRACRACASDVQSQGGHFTQALDELRQSEGVGRAVGRNAGRYAGGFSLATGHVKFGIQFFLCFFLIPSLYQFFFLRGLASPGMVHGGHSLKFERG